MKNFWLIMTLCLCACVAVWAQEETPPGDDNAPAVAEETTPVAVQEPQADAPVVPPDTLLVARLKSIDTLGQALDALKAWISEHPSVESLFDDEWQAIEKFDLRTAAAQYMDMTQEEFDNFFEGALTLRIGASDAWAMQEKSLASAIELTASTPERAQEFVQLLKDEDSVIETAAAAEGVERIRLDMTQQDAQVQDSTALEERQMDLYVGLAGKKVILGNSLEYTLACVKALGEGDAQSNAFWARVAQSDASAWVDTKALARMLRAQLEAKKANQERAMDPKVFDELKLDEVEGLGVWMSFVPLQVQLELSYAPNTTGVARLLTCAPTGLEASPLVPADATEFSLGRVDVAALWGELRRIAKIVMPATDVIYQGWQKQLEEAQGVNIDRQLFGAFGNRYVLFSRGSRQNLEGSALYVAVNDPVALQSGLEALFGFFAQGKELFDKEKIANVPVWRLKSEFQQASAPPIAYAITPQWLIVSVGDPTQMQELIENASHTQVEHTGFESEQIKNVLGQPAATTLSYRPLKVALENFAAALVQVQERQQAEDAEQGDDQQQDDAQARAPAAREVPSFDDVKESLILWNESRPGDLLMNIKIISNDE